MKIAYNAIGKSELGKPILGHVFFDSKLQASPSKLRYPILAYHFLCDNMFHSAAGAAAGYISIPIGPTPDVVDPGSSVWQMGIWVTNTGVIFQAADNTLSPAQTSIYKCLPPRMELSCEFVSAGPFGPFHPKGWLKLIWDPQFAMTKGLVPDFFDHIEN